MVRFNRRADTYEQPNACTSTSWGFEKLHIWRRSIYIPYCCFFFFFQAEDGIRDLTVTGVQTCALPISQDVVTLPPGDEKHQPAILIRDPSGKVRKKYLMPSRAHLMVRDGDDVQAGDVLAKIPRETTKTKDITGGLPRVVEIRRAHV